MYRVFFSFLLLIFNKFHAQKHQTWTATETGGGSATRVRFYRAFGSLNTSLQGLRWIGWEAFSNHRTVASVLVRFSITFMGKRRRLYYVLDHRIRLWFAACCSFNRRSVCHPIVVGPN